MPGPRWPAKREVAALWILHEMGEEVELNQALAELKARLCVTKRTAMNIIKRLRRLGALSLARAGDRVVVRPVNPVEFISSYVERYVAWRRGRCPNT